MGKKVNYNTQTSLKPDAPPGPRTLPPTLSKASPGLLIHTGGSGTDGGKHIKLFCTLHYQISCPVHLGRVTSDSAVLHRHLSCLILKCMAGCMCCNYLYSACIDSFTALCEWIIFCFGGFISSVNSL